MRKNGSDCSKRSGRFSSVRSVRRAKRYAPCCVAEWTALIAWSNALLVDIAPYVARSTLCATLCAPCFKPLNHALKPGNACRAFARCCGACRAAWCALENALRASIAVCRAHPSEWFEIVSGRSTPEFIASARSHGRGDGGSGWVGDGHLRATAGSGWVSRRRAGGGGTHPGGGGGRDRGGRSHGRADGSHSSVPPCPHPSPRPRPRIGWVCGGRLLFWGVRAVCLLSDLVRRPISAVAGRER